MVLKYFLFLHCEDLISNALFFCCCCLLLSRTISYKHILFLKLQMALLLLVSCSLLSLLVTPSWAYLEEHLTSSVISYKEEAMMAFGRLKKGSE